MLYDIPALDTAAVALHESVKLLDAVQLRANEELVRVMVGPVETTTPSLPVHV